jgi:hypothetical protein
MANSNKIPPLITVSPTPKGPGCGCILGTVLSILLVVLTSYLATHHHEWVSNASTALVQLVAPEPTATPLMEPLTTTAEVSQYSVLRGAEFEVTQVGTDKIRNHVALEALTKGQTVPYSSLGPQLEAGQKYSIMTVQVLPPLTGLRQGITATFVLQEPVPAQAPAPAATSVSAAITPQPSTGAARTGDTTACVLRDAIVLRVGASSKDGPGTVPMVVAVKNSSIEPDLGECFASSSTAYPLVSVSTGR